MTWLFLLPPMVFFDIFFAFVFLITDFLLLLLLLLQNMSHAVLQDTHDHAYACSYYYYSSFILQSSLLLLVFKIKKKNESRSGDTNETRRRRKKSAIRVSYNVMYVRSIRMIKKRYLEKSHNNEDFQKNQFVSRWWCHTSKNKQSLCCWKKQ